MISRKLLKESTRYLLEKKMCQEISKLPPRLNYMQLLYSSEITPSLIRDLQVNLKIFVRYRRGSSHVVSKSIPGGSLEHSDTIFGENESRQKMLMRQFVSAAPPHIPTMMMSMLTLLIFLKGHFSGSLLHVRAV
jgi:hypothetical protein